MFWLMAGRAPDVGERRILVDQNTVLRLVKRWDDSFHRLPSQAEIDDMIREYVSDQVYYREALRLGLDQDDEVVMRRMRRKMEEMAIADAQVATPSDSDLQAMLDKDPARYASDPRFSFDQIYLGADSEAIRAQVPQLLDRLKRGQPVQAVVAPLPANVDRASIDEIAANYGDEFAGALRNLPLGQWSGPIASGLGLHLVRLNQKIASQSPSLAAVRQRVENDWRADRIARAQAESYKRMLKGYDVVIELPR